MAEGGPQRLVIGPPDAPPRSAASSPRASAVIRYDVGCDTTPVASASWQSRTCRNYPQHPGVGPAAPASAAQPWAGPSIPPRHNLRRAEGVFRAVRLSPQPARQVRLRVHAAEEL